MHVGEKLSCQRVEVLCTLKLLDHYTWLDYSNITYTGRYTCIFSLPSFCLLMEESDLLSTAWSYFPFPTFFWLWIQYTVTRVPMKRFSGGSTRHSSGTSWVFPSYLGELLSFHVTQMYNITNSRQSYMYHALTCREECFCSVTATMLWACFFKPNQRPHVHLH